MTEENNNTEVQTENGAFDPSQLPSMRVLGQYVKDLSFENPNAPKSLEQTAQPKIDLQIDVSAKVLEDKSVFEVDLKVNAKSESDQGSLFICELVYSGLFQFANVSNENLEPMLLIECPRLLFPFARQIIADCSRNGGFAPFYLEPIDFAALYFSQKQGGALDS